MNNEQLDNIRHSAAHMLAAAILELYPGTKLGIGPTIEHGFYYDFQFEDGVSVSENDLKTIQDKMKEIIKGKHDFSGRSVSVEQAKEEEKDQPFKLELIDEFSEDDKELTIYESGPFKDLCRGGHVENTSEIPTQGLKLHKVAGAYWRGNEKNPMLTRIYGLLFPTKQELKAHLHMLEEAKKRDHRKLGKEYDLFTFSDLVGSGLPLFTPKGTVLREELIKYSEGLRKKIGYQKIWTPHITKNDLYKTSGHWDKFGDELLLVQSQETNDELVMKPMNCPHHQQVYASQARSYRDLPLRFMETTTDYRDEKTGELLGLSRVRSLTQDDSHTFCTPDQIEDVYSSLIGVVQEFYDTVGMRLRARLSYRDKNEPDKYLGDPELWDQAEAILLKIAKAHDLDYYEVEGEAAFYGPKIDFMALDAIGREWQVATPQLDFVQPKRFGLTYTDSDGQDKTPVMIHFALMGSIERFLSVYIEHTAGVFPVWLSPVQVQFVPVSEKHADGTYQLKEEFFSAGFRVQVDSADETVGNKIRKAVKQKIPYIVVVGDRELEGDEWTIRVRGQEDQEKMNKFDFLTRLSNEVKDRSI